MAKIAIEIFPDGRLDTRNAAAYIGLTVRTLENKRSNGTGPKFIKRGRVFYYRDDLDEWLRGGSAVITIKPVKEKRKASG